MEIQCGYHAGSSFKPQEFGANLKITTTLFQKKQLRDKKLRDKNWGKKKLRDKNWGKKKAQGQKLGKTFGGEMAEGPAGPSAECSRGEMLGELTGGVGSSVPGR